LICKKILKHFYIGKINLFKKNIGKVNVHFTIVDDGIELRFLRL